MRDDVQRTLIRLALMTFAGTVMALTIGAVITQVAFTHSESTTVAQAARDSDSILITLSGRIYTKAQNKFLIKDSTGAAEVDTCPPWFRKIIIPLGTKVRIRGEIMETPPTLTGAKYRIAAHAIYMDGGPDIILRTTLGKPPWASSSYIPRAQ